MLLLGHAAADADHQAGVLLFELFQRTDIAEHPLLGVLTHGTGVEQDEVGVLDIVTQAVADILQNALDFLSVVDVLLAAVAAHIRQRWGLVVGRQHLGRSVIVGIGQFFQVNSPYYKTPGSCQMGAPIQTYHISIANLGQKHKRLMLNFLCKLGFGMEKTRRED